MKMICPVRASNTKKIIGWRIGFFSAWSCSKGTVDHYRNGWSIEAWHKKLAFIPTSGHRSLR